MVTNDRVRRKRIIDMWIEKFDNTFKINVRFLFETVHVLADIGI